MSQETTRGMCAVNASHVCFDWSSKPFCLRPADYSGWYLPEACKSSRGLWDREKKKSLSFLVMIDIVPGFDHVCHRTPLSDHYPFFPIIYRVSCAVLKGLTQDAFLEGESSDSTLLSCPAPACLEVHNMVIILDVCLCTSVYLNTCLPLIQFIFVTLSFRL